MAQVVYATDPHESVSRCATSRWSLQGDFDWREWDGELVVRVDSSGETHVLATPASAVVKAIRGGAVDVEDIAAAVFADCTTRSTVTTALAAKFARNAPGTQRVLQTLAKMQAVGLVRTDLA